MSERDARLREPRPGDLDALVELCAEHAAYERAAFARAGLRAGLADCLFGAAPRLFGRVAEGVGGLLGYATWTRDTSTWRASDYAHLDCLFVRAEARGRGLGAALLRAVARDCARSGLDRIEWQTPTWNGRAIAFYERLGASFSAKARFGADTAQLTSEPAPD